MTDFYGVIWVLVIENSQMQQVLCSEHMHVNGL